MKKIGLFLLPAAAIVFYFSLSGDADHTQTVLDEREKKEKFLKESDDSPFQLAGVPMKALDYFEIDPKYKVHAKVEKITKREYLTISNSDGTSQRHLKYAILNFKLDRKEHSLTVLKPMYQPGYFLGFADQTSAETSYGAGRFLDIGEIKGDRITIDFNLAYNPYCAYDPGFVCPFPPKENVLSVAIEAGEKDYKY